MSRFASQKIDKQKPIICLVMLLSVGLTAHADGHAKAHEQAGDMLQLAIPAAGLAVAVAKDDKEGIQQWGKTMATDVVATYGLKYAFNHTALGKRPNGGRYSFPSGHTSAACAGATFIGQRYGWEYGAGAAIPAAYVGWSRVHANKHHTRDVIAGCAVGIASGLLMTKPLENTHVTAWYDDKAVGLSVHGVW